LNFVRSHIEKAKAAGLSEVPIPEEFKAHPHPEGKDRRWRRALYGGLQQARFRKVCLLNGQEWPWEKPLREPKIVVMKGHKREAQRRERSCLDVIFLELS